MHVTIYADGCCRPDPGQASCAAGVATAPQPDTIGNIQRITAGQSRWGDVNPVTGETWDDYDERRGDDHG